MSNINGYLLREELKNDKSGFAKWGFATKNGGEYFIKEFLSPVYPMDTKELSLEQVERKRDICKAFEKEKRAFYNTLNRCSTGNIITISDFFRHDSRYYIITEKVKAVPINPQDIAAMSYDQKMLIIKVILYCINSIHKRGIIHGDIKVDNILFKKTDTGMFTPKVIDFDSSFTEAKPPNDEELQGDMVYFAPESFILVATGEGMLTTKIDVFALGVLFHQYFTGELPGFDNTKYDYVFEAVLDDTPLVFGNGIPEFFKPILTRMLNKEPDDRPDVSEVFNTLSTADKTISLELGEDEDSYNPYIDSTRNIGGPSIYDSVDTGSVRSGRLVSTMGRGKSGPIVYTPSPKKVSAPPPLAKPFFKTPSDDLL